MRLVCHTVSLAGQIDKFRGPDLENPCFSAFFNVNNL